MSTTATFVAVYPEVIRDQYFVHLHAPGCVDLTRRAANRHGQQSNEQLNLDDPAQYLPVLDPDELGWEASDVKVLNCATELWQEHKAAQKPAKAPRRSRKATAPAPTPQPASASTTPAKKLSSRAADNASEIKNRRMATQASPAKARRSGKAADEATKKAAQIVEDALSNVAGTPRPEQDPSRRPGVSDAEYALAIEVRRLRGEGKAWWLIAHEMELKGHGPSAKQGKTGAAQARRLWEKAWGATYKTTNVPRETKAIKQERAATRDARPYFTPDVPEAEIVSRVGGQTITWFTRVGTNGGAVVSEQTAQVAPKGVQVVEGPKGRVLEFFEMIYEEGKKIPLVGPRRSVYLERIERVGA